MFVESYQPPETDELARLKVRTSMLVQYAIYERCDLAGLFKTNEQGDLEDEV